MKTLSKGLSASSGPGRARSTKLAITPSKRRSCSGLPDLGQKRSPLKASTTAADPPWMSIAYSKVAPPTWEHRHVDHEAVLAVMNDMVSGPNIA